MSKTALAILLSLLSLLLFDIMGLIIKHLSPHYTAMELSAWRNAFGMVPSFIALWSARSWHQKGRPVVIRQWKLAVFRGVCITFAQLSFYMSLGVMAFATSTTITYANALFVTALAVPILGERVGLWRWAAVMVGFAGVVMVVGPGRDAFSPWALLPLIAAFLYAMSAVTSQRLDADVPTPLANLYSSSVAFVGSVIMAFTWGGFTTVASSTDLFWLVTMGAVGGSAVLLLVSAYRMTEQSNLAPFSYFGIPLAFVMGWLVFDEAPWRDLFPGAILIIAGGLMIIWREQRLKQQRLKAA